MRLRQIITTEEADATSTTAGDIATVAYPLFVPGRSRRAKRRAARLAVGQRTDSAPSYIGRGVYEQATAEAHTLNSDNVIYRLDREDPMNASEVLVLGGAGRYSMAGLRDKARREARALAADLEGNHGGAFRGAAHNIKQLTNTLNTIVAAYNELKRIRSRGGRGSRGITDEDANFIRECLAIAEQWTQRYIAENGRNPGTPIPFPPGTTEIDVSDTTDWYRLGLEISDLDDAEPEEFNQGPPHTVVTFANDEMEQPYLKQFKRLGFKVKDIDQPDVRKFSKQEKKS